MFVVQLVPTLSCSRIWQNSDRHVASRGPSAVAGLLVDTTFSIHLGVNASSSERLKILVQYEYIKNLRVLSIDKNINGSSRLLLARRARL